MARPLPREAVAGQHLLDPVEGRRDVPGRQKDGAARDGEDEQQEQDDGDSRHGIRWLNHAPGSGFWLGAAPAPDYDRLNNMAKMRQSSGPPCRPQRTRFTT